MTSGGGDEAPIAEFMNHFMITTGITPVGSVWATMGAMKNDEFSPEIVEKADALGRKLVRDWQDRVSPPYRTEQGSVHGKDAPIDALSEKRMAL